MTRPFTLGLTGDVMFRERLSTLQQRWPSKDQILGTLRGCDVALINQEMPLTRRGAPVPKMSNLRADPDVVFDIRADDGFASPVVSLANNHMLDYGAEGLFDTIETLDRAGINHVGAGANIVEALRPHYETVGSCRIAFISIAATLPPGSEASEDRPGIAPIRVTTSFDIDSVLIAEQPGTAPQVRTRLNISDLTVINDVVRRAKCSADLVVIAIHWGVTSRMLTPFQDLIADYQPLLARSLIDEGADLIVGHHSHRLDGIEFYRGKPVLYGLGNFIFAARRPHMAREGMVVRLEYAADEPASRPRILLTPFLLNEWGCPTIASDEAEATRVFDVLSTACEPFSTHIERFGLEAVVEPDC